MIGDSGADALAGFETFGPADVDLTLGGLNQDLPEPSTSCLDADVDNWACFAGTASINGVVREVTCDSILRIATNGTSFHCKTPDPDNEDVELAVGWLMAPGTFDNIEDTVPNNLLRLDLNQGSYSSRLPNFVEGRATGWVNKFIGRLGLSDSVWGTVAATWTATTDAGVDELRIRGTFHIRSNI